MKKKARKGTPATMKKGARKAGHFRKEQARARNSCLQSGQILKVRCAGSDTWRAVTAGGLNTTSGSGQPT
eukprot:1160806-Pelagomonas_calceolata.AAC.5